MTRAQAEYLVATAIVALLLAFLVPALLNARAAVRDDLRRTDITNLKRAMETYNNTHNFYPAPATNQPGCTDTNDTDSWLFDDHSVLLKEQHMAAIPHDVREFRGHVYSYCATYVEDGQASGYYLEAQLEVEQPDIVAHDEDDQRNFDYRVLHEDGKILYRVCGGTETQCTPSS